MMCSGVKATRLQLSVLLLVVSELTKTIHNALMLRVEQGVTNYRKYMSQSLFRLGLPPTC